MLAMMALVATQSAWAGAKASHFKADSKKGANYWNANSAIDGKMDTAWMVPGESPNRGEWIELDVPKGEIDKIGIMAGWNRDEETYNDYPRVKQLRVDVYDLDDDQNPKQIGTATVDVPDKHEWQILDIPDVKVGAEGLFGGKVRISVVDIYDGEDFPNLGLSELLIYLKEWDTDLKVASVSAGDAGPAQDGNVKTVATFAAGTEFTFEPGQLGIGSIGFQGDKAFSKVKTVEVTQGGRTATTVLQDKPDLQWAAVPGFNGFTGGGLGAISVRIVDSYPGTKPEIGVAEIKVRATSRDTL
jgi:hypothetical protein